MDRSGRSHSGVNHSGMDEVQTLSGSRIELVLEMLRELSRAKTRGQVTRAFVERSLKLRPMDYVVAISTRGLEPGQFRITRRTDPGPIIRHPKFHHAIQISGRNTNVARCLVVMLDGVVDQIA